MIDFSTIKIPELPHKKVNIVFNGKSEEFEITPMTGSIRFCFISLDANDDHQDTRSLKRLKYALSCVIGLTEEAIDKLILVDWRAAVELCDRVYEFTREYEIEFSKLAEQAEKNSPVPNGMQVHTV